MEMEEGEIRRALFDAMWGFAGCTPMQGCSKLTR